MIEALLLVSLITGAIPCKDIYELASAYANKLHGSHLRELDPQQVQHFNAQPPETEWTQVWLMDLEGNAGMVFAGNGNDKACYTGVLNPASWHKAIDDLEPRT